jgi:hypothetical protein
MYFWHRLFRDHKWKVIRTRSINAKNGYDINDFTTLYGILNEITSECEICGDLKVTVK